MIDSPAPRKAEPVSSLPAPSASSDPTHADIFVGDSEMARLMRGHDWSASLVGPPAYWPQTLKVAMRLLLTSRFEMWIGWGPQIAFFYNDAYRPTLGNKHPRALGAATQELWAEIWDVVRPRIEVVYREGRSTWDRALPLLLERAGYAEETYHTFSYSPLLGDTGQVEGLFCAVSEETHRVISERRLTTLGELATALAKATTRSTAIAAVEATFSRATHDLPFTLIYLFDAVKVAHLAATCGMSRSHGLAPAHISNGSDGPWRAETIRQGEPSVSVSLAAVPDDLPAGAWQRPPDAALVVPIASQGDAAPLGFLVAGLNPHRQLDVDYMSFIQLLAGQIASSFASVDAYDLARQRAEQLAETARAGMEAGDLLRSANAHLSAEIEARTAERDRLRTLFRQAPGFMCVLSGPQHVFELTNESYLQVIGHRNVGGRPIREALPELVGQGFYELLDNVLTTGQPYVGLGISVMLQREPGAALEERFLNFVYQPIFGTEGTPIGVFAEGNDVTEQIAAERALKALNETLEQRIEQRTYELAEALERLRAESAERESVQEALRQSQKMEAVGQLTGGIAHDFNNLLQGITGSLELVRRRFEQGRLTDIDRFIGDATGSAKRAAALTHRLLAFSRRQPLDPKAVRANPLIASMEDLLRRTLGERISLELVLAGGLWTTLCDANQLESAVLNLCINARDAMPDGGTLTIETGNAHLDRTYAVGAGITAGQYIGVSVTDTGTGMTPDVASRAFDPFFTTKPIGQGTGLGLSMIYGFARQSEGHVRIYTEPGAGTSVKLYLPRLRGPETAEEATAPQVEPRGSDSGETVLVIEDDAVVRSLIVEILNELRYHAIEASDGPTGLDILRSQVKIDLLVTDIGLPGLNGRQVADAARLLRPDLKVLFMTGYAENAAFAGGFLEPGMEMMTKPFAMEALALRLREMIEKR